MIDASIGQAPRRAMSPPRTPWQDFPDVFIHAAESAVKQHAQYRSAKSGDADSAADLVSATLNMNQVQALAEWATARGWVQPTLVSAHAYERDGVNAIPEAFADVLGRQLGWPVDGGILQVNVVAHTGADGWSRLARPAAFDGPATVGAHYVLVDDFVGMGGTLANLKGHIESQGGRVLAAVALTGKPYSAKLAVSRERLCEVREKHGRELENWWQQKFGHAFDALTESEARYLARTPDADAVRNRLAAAEQAGNRAAGG
jgi:hypothetical protein